MIIAVIGGGAWGTALAAHMTKAGHDVRLWAFEREIVERINREHRNTFYLPDIDLPPKLVAMHVVAEAVTGAETVVMAVPSEFSRSMYRDLAPRLEPMATIVSATKGIDIDTLQRISQLATEEIGDHPVAVLSGPSFAIEVAREQPTAVVAASSDLHVADRIQRLFATRFFRVYSSDDIIGVELGGALKNVIALAAGVLDGLGFGHNTLAALITRGLVEISRLAVAFGARAETLAGLAGLGDLVLTCTGSLSRNRRVGQAIGRGKPWRSALQGNVAEGIRTTLAACALAERVGVEMPIASQMKAVIYDGKSPMAAVDELMLRRLKRE
ncbi:MAG: NAD(P)-dependent glycerol-3-phosphate dehydrogenase [Vicinamibacteria bacterium]|nr:NAD(P)-dependent glycerol-3-phosphate dehydrogenase [Vicinamibacteria bacterium]